MTVKYKPIFQCDGCSLEFEDPDKVRIFESLVKNGDQTKQYIETGMFCLNCIPLALDFKNENPETIKIIEPIKALADTEDQFEKQYHKITERLNLDSIIKALIEKIDNHKHITPDHDHVKILELYDKIQKLEVVKSYNENTMKEEWDVKDITPKALEDQILKEEAQHFLKSIQETIPENSPKLNELIDESNEPLNKLKHGDKLTEKYVEHISTSKDPQEHQEEPETINEIDNSETEKDMLEDFGKPFGKYLVLKLINDEIEEKKFAKKQGYKNVIDLRVTCGIPSLVGLYYSINRFVDDPNIGRIDMSGSKKIKIINKMFFGVPNITDRELMIFPDMKLALIEKDQFDDKIEPIKYELPKEPDIEIPDEHEIEIPEIHQDIEPRKTVKSMLDKFANEVFQKPTKKTFSSRNIGDEYI